MIRVRARSSNAGAQRLLANPEKIFAELAQGATERARDRSLRAPHPRCPVCEAELDRTRTYELTLDVCRGHGTWFDALELSQLLYVLTKGSIGDAPPALKKIRCAHCGTEILASRANLGPDGLVCEFCAQQSLLHGLAREDAYEHSMGGALLGIAGIMLSGGK